MAIEFLMDIGFIFKTNGKEKRIVGGPDPKYSIEDLSWLDFTNKNIVIKVNNSDFLFKVKKIDIFPAISDKFNIGLTLFDDLQFDFLNIGDKVYKITETENVE